MPTPKQNERHKKRALHAARKYGPSVIITGSPINGFTIYGPVDLSTPGQLEEVQPLTDGRDWWIAPLYPPKEK